MALLRNVTWRVSDGLLTPAVGPHVPSFGLWNMGDKVNRVQCLIFHVSEKNYIKNQDKIHDAILRWIVKKVSTLIEKLSTFWEDEYTKAPLLADGFQKVTLLLESHHLPGPSHMLCWRRRAAFRGLPLDPLYQVLLGRTQALVTLRFSYPFRWSEHNNQTVWL